MPFAVDEAGWQQLGELFNETLERMLLIRADSEERLAAAGEEEEAIRGVGFQLFFELPPREKPGR